MRLLESASPRGRAVRIGAIAGASLALAWVLLVLVLRLVGDGFWVGLFIVVPLQLLIFGGLLSGIGALIGLAVAGIRGLPGKPPIPVANSVSHDPLPPPPPSPDVAPGWYPAPDNPVLLRYWDGGRWTEHTAPRVPQ